MYALKDKLSKYMDIDTFIWKILKNGINGDDFGENSEDIYVTC